MPCSRRWLWGPSATAFSCTSTPCASKRKRSDPPGHPTTPREPGREPHAGGNRTKVDIRTGNRTKVDIPREHPRPRAGNRTKVDIPGNPTPRAGNPTKVDIATNGNRTKVGTDGNRTERSTTEAAPRLIREGKEAACPHQPEASPYEGAKWRG